MSGIVAGAMAALALVVVGASIVGARRGFPGPGAAVVGWHMGAAAVVVAAQVYADRRRNGWIDSGVALVVFATVGALLWTQWWD